MSEKTKLVDNGGGDSCPGTPASPCERSKGMPVPVPHANRMPSSGSLGAGSYGSYSYSRSPPTGGFTKSPNAALHGKVVLTKQPSTSSLKNTPSSPGREGGRESAPSPTPSPGPDPSLSVNDPTPMLMSRSHPQFHRKAYYEAIVKNARQIGETESQAGAFDHLLDQPIGAHEGFVSLEDAVQYQIVWLSSFFRNPLEEGAARGGGSLSIIFTIWTTMCGSTMLSLPWAFAQAGFLMSLVVFFGGFFVSLYTCRMIYKQSRHLGESDYFKIIKQMSPLVEAISTWTSTLVLVVALMSYHIYATQSITGCFSPSAPGWINKTTVAFLLAGLQFLISFIKNLDPLFKMSTFAIFFVLFNMSFIIVKSINHIGDRSCGTDGSEDEGVDNLSMYSSTWPKFAAVLCLSFFLHNLICPILSTASNKASEGRDMILGYSGTALCYLMPGLTSLLGYRYCNVSQNFLDSDMFPHDDYYALVARICVVMQNCMVYPLLVFICRSQVKIFFNQQGALFSAVSGFFIIIIATLPAAFGIGVGSICSIGGGVCGLVWIYFLPLSIHFWIKKSEGSKIDTLDVIGKAFILIYGLTTVGLLFQQTIMG
eukprot:TRINITY_DN15455_c0_g1_i1.p1 TRINITY_DN15455_c0_g1~~TRINITY_DN15455_c0_g1_i1.p1  ORF type:complete len:595 (+),score=91.76 TRINITY_DN15455_c0_g1_i1:37-1821(+)